MSEQIEPELVNRMVALVRKITSDQFATSIPIGVWQDARQIESELPAPIDPPEQALRAIFEAGYKQSNEDERNDGTPYPRWGIKRGFDRFVQSPEGQRSISTYRDVVSGRCRAGIRSENNHG